MAAGDIRLGNIVCSGEVEGTGSAIDIQCGFKPSYVLLINRTREVVAHWSDQMPAASAMISLGTASGTNAAENAHTHAVALDSGTSEAVSAGTPAGSVAAPTGTNAASAVTAKLNIGAPSFSGTGFATAGQVVTTTDNQTMAATDTAAGMWFVCPGDATSTPVLIMSNTIVAGAPAVLTCQGVPPATNAGAYIIVSDLGSAAAQAWTSGAAPAFTGSALATHTHGPGTLADAASAAGSSHTHAFTGAAAETVFVTTNGVTPSKEGFTIGTNAELNTASDVVYWVAIKD